MNGIIHRNNALKDETLASNVLMGMGKDKKDTVEKRIETIELAGGAAGSVVRVDPIVEEGVHIANITVNGRRTELYSPDFSEDVVTDVFVNGESVVSGGVANVDLSGKQDVLIAGRNVSIEGNVISASYPQISGEASFVLPSKIRDGAISDGSNSDVITFAVDCDKIGAAAIFSAVVNFKVNTTVDVENDVYGDCMLTVRHVLDGVTVATVTQTYGDGHQVLVLNYLLQNLAIGKHKFIINFAVTGGSII